MTAEVDRTEQSQARQEGLFRTFPGVFHVFPRPAWKVWSPFPSPVTGAALETCTTWSPSGPFGG